MSNVTRGIALGEGVVRTNSLLGKRTEELTVVTTTNETTKVPKIAMATVIIITNKLMILAVEMIVLAMVEGVKEYIMMHRPTTSKTAKSGSTIGTSLTLVTIVLKKGTSSTVVIAVPTTIRIATTKASNSTLARMVDAVKADLKMVVTVMVSAKVIGVTNNKPEVTEMSRRLMTTSLPIIEISMRVATIAKSLMRTQAGMTKMELENLLVEGREQVTRTTGELLK